MPEFSPGKNGKGLVGDLEDASHADKETSNFAMWNQAAAFFKSGPKVQYGWIHTNLLKLRPGPVSLLFSKLANPEAKTGTIEIPVTPIRG